MKKERLASRPFSSLFPLLPPALPFSLLPTQTPSSASRLLFAVFSPHSVLPTPANRLPIPFFGWGGNADPEKSKVLISVFMYLFYYRLGDLKNVQRRVIY
jgi:hypothetical protein